MLGKISIVSILVLFVFFSLELDAQEYKSTTFQYISPVPGSKYIMPENNIALRHGEELNTESLNRFKLEVNGSISGNIFGNIVVSDDQKTLIFNPEKPFTPGERITVLISGNVTTKSGKLIAGNSFWFDITENIPEIPEDYYFKEEVKELIQFTNPNQAKYAAKKQATKNNNLPDDFPELTVEVSNIPADNGYYFSSPFGYWGWFPDNVPYLIIFDDFGTPVFYRKLTGHGYDLKKHSNGKISHFLNNWPNSFINVLDSSYNVTDIYTMQNGYSTDFHEFLMLPNGHVVIEGYDPQIVDMSQIVPGGNPEAVVSGWIIQELDVNKNVVFQWRSWDHFDITDAVGIDLTAANIDPIHGNAIEPYTDDYFLLSTKNLNEITKISRNTGEIVWRLEGKNNMFEFINDTLGFSRQHDCRIIDNGNLTLFDNGNDHTESPFSSMIEYELDEINHTATQVKRYRSNPDIFGAIMGNAQKTPDNRFVTGWGSGVPGITEFTETGEIAMEIYFAGINYRAYRQNWKTNRFYPETDALFYGYLWMEETRTKDIKFFNDQNEDVLLTSYHSRTNNYIVENEFPIIVPANGYANVYITILPDGAGTYRDIITFNSDINTEDVVQRIAQQISVICYVSEGQSIGENNLKNIVVYPNPVKDNVFVKLENQSQSVNIKLFDAFGKLVGMHSIENSTEGNMDLSSFSSGLYFMQITDLKSNSSALVKIQKQ